MSERRNICLMADCEDKPTHFCVAHCLEVHAPEVERLRHERDELGKAIANAAIKVGIIDGMQPLTGPQLITLCDDLAQRDQLMKENEELKRQLVIGDGDDELLRKD